MYSPKRFLFAATFALCLLAFISLSDSCTWRWLGDWKVYADSAADNNNKWLGIDSIFIISEGFDTTSFVVTKTADTADGSCDADCSLREAITVANRDPGAETISFNIPSSDAGCNTTTTVCTISPTSQLPIITGPATIDGYTQTGASANTLPVGNNAVLKIELNGASAGGSNGLFITAGNSTVRGLVINRFDDPGSNGIVLQVAGGNTIAGNFIGTDAAGNSPLPNTFGVVLRDGTSNNTIGTNADGTGDAAERNLISGNSALGLIIQNVSNNNRVAGNYIGTNAVGMAAVKNGFNGLFIASPASNNTVGGTTAAARNVISGNDVSGIRIGTDGATTGPADDGAALSDSAGSITPSGVVITAATNNIVRGNYIGVAADGTSPLGNTPGSQLGWGVIVVGMAQGNTIGGSGSGEANLIAFNAGPGVEVTNSAALNNRISGNSIFSNGGLGIDLDPNGVTPNDNCDTDTGPNNLQNFPVLTTAMSSGSNTTVAGTLNSTASTQFTIEFFANDACDPSGNGEGQTFLGARTVTTDGSCNASFSFMDLPAVAANQVITATATDPAGNTSEFSACLAVVSPTPTPTPTPDIDPAGSTLVSESCPPSNGAVDPGERVSVRLTLMNNGGVSTSNLVATLQSSANVIAPSGPQSYGAIAPGGMTARPFTFTADGAPGQTISLTLQLQDGANNLGTAAFPVVLGSNASCRGVSLVVTSTLLRLNSSTVQATYTVQNTGAVTANSVMLTTAQLGATNGTTLPQSLGSLAPGQTSAPMMVNFLNSTPSTPTLLRLNGTYTGGIFNSTKRVTIP